MRILKKVRLRLRSLFRRSSVESELEAELHFHLAHLFAEQRDWSAAVAEYRLALILAPGATEAYDGLAEAWLAQNDWGRALAEYRVAVTLNPSNAAAHQQLALGFERNGNLQSAASEIALAYRLEPGDPGMRADFDRLQAKVKR